ncbi:TPM domain-containing protein [uncultured Bacteroides sp.]|uniref:TPM domain-containing protein n=1 Tax=uncultured Bacteroides sp. TaxID=162156 RepID=UPI002621946E|nr:TPM domain-containing protein [uncultured Bacteroides sp.]
MKRSITTILFCLSLSLITWAQTVYTTDNLPNVHLQDKTRYTTDPENILTSEARNSIDRMLYQLEQKTGIQSVVAVVPSIGEEDCFDFCHQLLNKWGVGQKGKDNGLIILLVTDQRCIQFYTGYGLEGPLPDAICKRIQTRDMIPYLKDERWSEGMEAGIRATCAHLDGSAPVGAPDKGNNDSPSLGFILLGVFGLLGVALLIGIMAQYAASRCPQCGQHKLQRTSSQLIARRAGIKTEEVTYVCRNCGHRVVRRQQSYDENYRGRGGGGPVIFGGGGGFSGGGFGGSFGGGSGGGGGAGSRF